MAIRVAFDMTPTLGTRTGIGYVVDHLYSEISRLDSITLQSYTLSFQARNYRSELPKDNIFVPYPARILLSAWKKTNWFSLDQTVGDIDIWHATNYLAPPTPKPLLITIHDATMVKYPELVTPQIRSLAPTIQKRLNNGAHVHVPTTAIKDDVVHHFKDVDDSRIHVVPFALPELEHVSPSEATQQLCEGDPYILSIGSLEPRKNHARLIRAFGLIYESNPHVRLLLVGPDGPARPSIDTAMAELSHSARSRIVITGPVSNADRTWLLRHAHVLAYPSLYEGFGLPVLEAMATQTPILTTNEGALAEVAGEAAVIVDPLNIEEIAEGLNEILNNADLRDKLIVSGESRIAHYSWEHTAHMMADVYTHIAGKEK